MILGGHISKQKSSLPQTLLLAFAGALLLFIYLFFCVCLMVSALSQSMIAAYCSSIACSLLLCSQVNSSFRTNKCYFYQSIHGTHMSNLGLITHAEKLITLSTLLLDSIDRDRVGDLCLPHKPGAVLLHALPNSVCFKKMADMEQETRKRERLAFLC